MINMTGSASTAPALCRRSPASAWRPAARRQAAFTLIELMVAVAVVAILATLAAPSFYNFILMQRMKGIHAQLVTDLQFARSEAVTRNALMRLYFLAGTDMTCYTVYVNTTIDNAASNAEAARCLCTSGPAAACPVGGIMREVKTVQVPRSLGVRLAWPGVAGLSAGTALGFAFDPVTGGLMSIPADNPSVPTDFRLVLSMIDTPRALGTRINRAGRPGACAPTGSTLPGEACL